MKRLIYLLLAIAFSSTSLAQVDAKKKLVFDWFINSEPGLSDLVPLIDSWYDGQTSGVQLLDRSGNARHATLTSNLVTDGSSELGNTLIHVSGTAPTTNTSYTGDFYDDPAVADSRCYRVAWTSIPAFSVVRTDYYPIVVGDQVNLSFRVKRVSNTLITWAFRQGDGSTNFTGGTGNFNAITLGVWSNPITVTATATVGGGLSHLLINPGAGVHEILIDVISVTVTGQTSNAFYLPVDATLASRDTENIFYTTAGIPKTIRGAYTYGAYHNDKIYCGGAFEYIFFNTALTASQDYAVATQFEDLDHAFDSCPVTKTVCASGCDYTTVQAGINAWTSLGTNLHRIKITINENLSVTTRAGYTVTVGTNTSYIAVNKAFVYITGLNSSRITITADKEDNSSDAQMGTTEIYSPIYPSGIRWVNMTKRDGGYLVHEHFAGMVNAGFIYKDCSFTDLGSQDIINYRIANAQSYATISNGKAAFAGGFEEGFKSKKNNCSFAGIYAYTEHDQDVNTSPGAKIWLRDCTFTSDATIYDPIYNNNATTHDALLLTSHGVANGSSVYLQRATIVSGIISEVIASGSKSITLYQY